MDPIDRAAEVFYSLKMEQTVNRNGVLVYVAVKDRQLAICRRGASFRKPAPISGKRKYSKCCVLLIKENYALGIATTVKQIGKCYRSTFPYEAGTDKNELPDDIVLENNFLQVLQQQDFFLKMKSLLSFLLCIAVTSAVFSQKILPRPNSPRLVNDEAHVLSPEQVGILEERLVALDDSTSNQIAIVTIPTLDDYPIEDYAVALFRSWGIGTKRTTMVF